MYQVVKHPNKHQFYWLFRIQQLMGKQPQLEIENKTRFAEILGTSRRNGYYLVEDLEKSGFIELENPTRQRRTWILRMRMHGEQHSLTAGIGGL